MVDKKSEENIFENRAISDLNDQAANHFQVKPVYTNIGGNELEVVELM